MKKINNIILFILSLILIAFNIFIGPSIKEPLIGIFVCNIFLCIILLIIKFIKKEKISLISNKLDLFVLLFFITSFIPIIFNKDTSLNNSYEYFQISISVIALYTVIKNLFIKEKTTTKILNILIFSSSIVIIIGFDRLYNGYIWNFISKYNYFYISYSGSDRFLSNFNYPNSLSIYLCCILFLLYNQFLNVKSNKMKIIYQTYSYILLLAIILTNSRATIILYSMFLLLYLTLLKKDKSIKIIKMFVISIVNIIIYFIISKLFYINNWVLLIISILIAILINYYSNKIYIKCNKNIDFKKIKYIILTIICILIGYMFIVFNYSKPVVIAEPTTYKIQKIKTKDKYNIKISLETKTNKNMIEIIEVNKYSNKITHIKDKFDKYSGIKKYTLTPSKDMVYYLIRISNSNNNKIKLNTIFIDDNEYIVNYKLIPNKVAYFFNTLNLKEKSLWQRIDYYKDGLKIAKDNWLFGTGFRGWNLLYGSYQNYNYVAQESHSFLLDVFISSGILGLISLLLIIGYILYLLIKLIKEKNIILNLEIILAILLLFTHSSIDFDMSFSLIFHFFFILLALISNIIPSKKETKKYTIIIFTLIMCTCFIVFILNIYSNRTMNKILTEPVTLREKYNIYEKIYKYNPTNKELRYYKITTKKNILYNIENQKEYNKLLKSYKNDIINFIKDEPFDRQLEMQKLLIDEIIINIEDGIINKDDLNRIYSILKECRAVSKYNYNYIIIRANYLKTLYNTLSKYNKQKDDKYICEITEKFKKILLDEEEKNLKLFKECYKTDYKLEEVNEYLNKYKTIIEEVK